VNVEGAVNLLEAASRAGVRKVTIASSSSVYGVNAKVPISECAPIFSAVSPYAASKLAGEAFGHVYGFDVAMLRFFTDYGPRQRPDHTYITDILDAFSPVPGRSSGLKSLTWANPKPSGWTA